MKWIHGNYSSDASLPQNLAFQSLAFRVQFYMTDEDRRHPQTVIPGICTSLVPILIADIVI